MAGAALRGEIGANHLGALGVHHLRVGSRAARHREEDGRVEPETLGEHQAFGQRQAIEAEDQIDRELGAPAVADLADMEAPRE